HVGARPDLRGRPNDLGTGTLVALLRDAGAGSGAVLDEDLVARGGELARTLGRQRNPVLVVLDLLRDPDDHGLALPRSGRGKRTRPGVDAGTASDRLQVLSSRAGRPSARPPKSRASSRHRRTRGTAGADASG